MNMPFASADIEQKEIKKTYEYDRIKMMELEIQYPQIIYTGKARPAARINRHYQNKALSFSRYAERELYPMAVNEYHSSQENGYPFREFSAVMHFIPTLNQACHLSTYDDSYTYTGGAHGSTTRRSDTFDLRTGRPVRLGELFDNEPGWRQRVLSLILAQADRNMTEEPIYFEDYRTLIVKYFNPESFYLFPGGVEVYYQQYEIAPYAAGIIAFLLPYEALGIKPPGCP